MDAVQRHRSVEGIDRASPIVLHVTVLQCDIFEGKGSKHDLKKSEGLRRLVSHQNRAVAAEGERFNDRRQSTPHTDGAGEPLFLGRSLVTLRESIFSWHQLNNRFSWYACRARVFWLPRIRRKDSFPQRAFPIFNEGIDLLLERIYLN